MGFFDFLKGAGGGAAAGAPFGPVGLGIGGLVGGLGSLFGSDENQEAQDAYNKYLQDVMASRQGVLSDLKGMGINPYMSSSQGTRSSQTTGTTDTTGYRNALNQMRKVVDPAQAEGKAALEKQVFGRLGQPAVSEGEMMRRLAEANKVYGALERKVADQAGVRGPMSRPGMMTGLAAERAGSLLDTLAQRPELERSRQMENEKLAQALLGQWQGQDTRSKERFGSTQNMFQNMLGSSGSQGYSPANAMAMANLGAPPGPMSTAAGNSQGDWLNFLGNMGAMTQQFAPGQQAPSPMTMPAPGSKPLMTPFNNMIFGG